MLEELGSDAALRMERILMNREGGNMKKDYMYVGGVSVARRR